MADCLELDVLIVGGGIVGSGVARCAAMRGLDVALIEQADFASGTSGRSSRMLHGGIRYLAQGHIEQVRHASKEKVIVSRIAPHLSSPLPFIFPTYRGTAWPKWKLAIGVKLYDLLCSGRNLGPSKILSAAQTLAMLQELDPGNLTGAVRYFDGATNDARLVLDTIRSADVHGASVFNYTRLMNTRFESGKWICEMIHQDSGKESVVRAPCVVNATGPWSDQVKHSRMLLRKTKGVHVVIERRRFDIPEAVMMTDGPRVVYAIPWGERVYIGTTDTDFHASPETVKTDPQDLEYILEVTNRFFPGTPLRPEDVMKTWAGVRPLVQDPAGRPSEVSRAHLIMQSHPGWFDVGGGKLTPYRLMAREVVDHLLKTMKRPATACLTANEPLLDENQRLRDYSGIIPPALSEDAVRHYCENEWAKHLDDVMIRRTRWHYYVREAREIAEKVAAWMGETLGWDSATCRHELDRYRAIED